MLISAFFSAVLAALAYHFLSSPPATGRGLCLPSSDARPACYFSESYFEARSRFRFLASKAGAELHAHAVAYGSDVEYTTDIAVIKVKSFAGLQGWGGGTLIIGTLDASILKPNEI